MVDPTKTCGTCGHAAPVNGDAYVIRCRLIQQVAGENYKPPTPKWATCEDWAGEGGPRGR